MKIICFNPQKGISIVLSILFLMTNCLLAYTPEINFWAERKRLKSLVNTQSKPTDVAHKMKEILRALPGRHGNVQKVYWPKNNTESPRIIIHIQDVHQNQEAQNNMSDVIRELVNRDIIQVVGLEGAFEPFKLDRFRNFPNKNTLQIVADDMLLKNEISGAIHAGLTIDRPIPSFIGVDDLLYYQQNVNAYKNSIPITPRYKKDLLNLKRKISQKKIKVFNSQLAQYDSVVESYRNEDLSLGNYVKFLLEQVSSPTKNIQDFHLALTLEASLNFSQVERQRTLVVNELARKLPQKDMTKLLKKSLAYQLGDENYAGFYDFLSGLCKKAGVNLESYRDFKKYVEYIQLADDVDAEDFLNEILILERKGFNQLVKTSEEQLLVSRSEYLNYLRKLIDFSLTSQEWSRYKHLATDNQGFFKDVSVYESFYKAAINRNQFLVRRTLKGMEKNDVSVAVLVSGGFHSKGIEEILEDQGIAHIVYSPKITRVPDKTGNSYLSVFAQDKTPLEEIFKGEKLFVAQNPFLRTSQDLGFATRAAAVEATIKNGVTPKEVLSNYATPSVWHKIHEVSHSIQNKIVTILVKFRSGRQFQEQYQAKSNGNHLFFSKDYSGLC